MSQTHDLVIRNGTIIDGLGGAPYRGNLGITGGRISAVGPEPIEGREEIDATDRLVTPGFVDIHTHYDGHVTWTDRLNPSSQHGVTTVLMGNCGVGFAPCKPEDRGRLVQLMEGVEDIPEVVMSAGLPWNWESFPEYLDSLDRRRFDMDVATQIPHAPLRVFVMGDRAMEKGPATPDDVARMRAMVQEGIEAGALGFSTSRSLNHRASDGTLTPSYVAAAEELEGIAGGLADIDKGVLQLISDFDDIDAEFAILERMMRASGRPMSTTVLQAHHVPDRWRGLLDRIEAANDAGLPIKGQIAARPIGTLIGFRLQRNPFMFTPTYQAMADLPLEERLARLATDACRAAILAEFPVSVSNQLPLMTSAFEGMYEFGEDPDYEPQAEESIAARAAAAGAPPAAFAYDRLIADEGGTVFYVPAANYFGNSTTPIEQMLASDSTLCGLGDGGAHCGLICDASLPTYMLSRWSDSGKGSIPVAKVVKALSADTAAAVGLDDRGMLRVGRRADVNIIDPSRLALHRPELVRDLPQQGGRLQQPASGYDATIVAGEVTYRNGVATGALPGRLVRGARQAA